MKKKKELNILVTNDDGIDSPGIYALARSLQKIGNVIVIAPDRQQSAVGHALTVSRPLRATKFHRDGKMFGFAVNGTPADSVKLALSCLLDFRPDLIVSGINSGKNTSINVIYSGTVSAATEGALVGIPSIAVSLDSYDLKADYKPAARFIRKFALKILETEIPKGTLINVNVPAIPEDEIKGTVFVSQSNSYWKDKYEERQDPFGRTYYWFAGEYNFDDIDENSDDMALRNGYISITPLHFNFTNSEFINILKRINNAD
jgi:5'-nucleotidase